MTALIRAGSQAAEAYADWSRWVARCSFCRYGAEQLRPWHPGLRPQTREPLPPCFECPACHNITEVLWPTESMVLGVERLLMMRPDPSTRNWLPGETLIDLAWENGAHGILDQFKELAVNPGESLLSVDPGRIRRDLLPALKPHIRQEITP